MKKKTIATKKSFLIRLKLLEDYISKRELKLKKRKNLVYLLSGFFTVYIPFFVLLVWNYNMFSGYAIGVLFTGIGVILLTHMKKVE